MSSPVFGGKMTSTSGKTRQSGQSGTRGVTSSLQVSTSRDSNKVMAVDTIVSDGSVSPFEAVDTLRGSDRVGSCPDRSPNVKDVSRSPDQQQQEEAIPLIMFTPYDNRAGQNNKQPNNNNSNKKNSSNNANDNTNRNSKNTPTNAKNNLTRSLRPIGRPVSNTGTRPNVKRVGSGVRRVEPKPIGLDRDNSEQTVNLLRDSQLRSGGNDGSEKLDCSKDVEEGRQSMLRGSGGSGDGICGTCGAIFDNGDCTNHICDLNNDNSNNNDDNDNVEHIHVKRKGRVFSCSTSKNKVRDKKGSSKRGSNTKTIQDGSVQSKNSGDTTKGVKVKTKVRFEETNVDQVKVGETSADSQLEIESIKAKSHKTKVGNEKVKVDSAKSKVKIDDLTLRDRRSNNGAKTEKEKATLPYTKVLNMIVFVPNMHLIPEGRKYEDYFHVKPRDDLEFGKKPAWIKPRLKHYAYQMGCGTSNQIISMEGKMPIVVFGATGVIGGAVVRALLKDPRFMVKAVTRTPTTDQARGLAEIGAVVVPADFNDVRSLQRVMEGAAGVFLTTNFWEHLSKQKELNFGMNAVDAAVSCNVHHFIFQGSEHTRDEDKPCGHLNAKAAIEEYVKETSLPFTSIHLPFLYENLLSLFKPHCVDGTTYTIPIPMGDQSMDCMSLHDFARCVVNIFLRPKNHMLKSVQLTGDRMSVQHMADVMNRHFDDRKFVYHKLNPSDFASFDFQGSQDLAAMFEYLQTAAHRDPRITRRIHHSVVCFDKWVADNKQKLVDAMKDTGDGAS